MSLVTIPQPQSLSFSVPSSEPPDIRKGDLPLKRVEKWFVDLVQSAHSFAESENQDAHRKIADWRNQYLGEVPERKRNYEGIADVWPNITLEFTDVAAGNIYRMLFPDLDFFDGYHRAEIFDRVWPLIKGLMIDGHAKSGFFQTQRRNLEYWVKYGTAILLPFWNFDREWMRVSEAVMENPATAESGFVRRPLERLVRKIVKDFPDHNLIYPGNWYFGDCGRPNLDDMDFVGDVFTATRTDLRRNEYDPESGMGYYHNLDLLKTSAVGDLGRDNSRDSKTVGNVRDKKLGSDNFVQRYWFQPGVIDLFDEDNNFLDEDISEFLTDYGIGVDEIDGGWVIEVANDKNPIRIQPNPYRSQRFPHIVGRFLRNDEYAWGLGMCWLLESDQFELADIENQMLDSVTINLNPPFIAPTGVVTKSGKGPKRIRLRPSEVNEVELSQWQTLDMLKPMTNVVNTEVALLGSRALTERVQRTAGQGPSMSGMTWNRTVTATQDQNMVSGGAGRMEWRASSYEDDVLNPLLHAEYELYQRFTTKKQAVRVLGQRGLKWQKIGPDDLLDGVMFIPIGSRTVQRDMALSQTMLQVLQNPALFPFMYPNRMLKDFFRGNQGPRGENYVRDPEEYNPPVTPEDQEGLFVMGHISPVDPNQPYPLAKLELAAHQFVQDQAMRSGKASPEELQNRQDHIDEHIYWIAKMEMAMQAMTQSQPAGGAVPAVQHSPTGDTSAPTRPDKETGRQSLAGPGGLGREAQANGGTE